MESKQEFKDEWLSMGVVALYPSGKGEAFAKRLKTGAYDVEQPLYFKLKGRGCIPGYLYAVIYEQDEEDPTKLRLLGRPEWTGRQHPEDAVRAHCQAYDRAQKVLLDKEKTRKKAVEDLEVEKAIEVLGRAKWALRKATERAAFVLYVQEAMNKIEYRGG